MKTWAWAGLALPFGVAVGALGVAWPGLVLAQTGEAGWAWLLADMLGALAGGLTVGSAAVGRLKNPLYGFAWVAIALGLFAGVSARWLAWGAGWGAMTGLLPLLGFALVGLALPWLAAGVTPAREVPAAGETLAVGPPPTAAGVIALGALGAASGFLVSTLLGLPAGGYDLVVAAGAVVAAAVGLAAMVRAKTSSGVPDQAPDDGVWPPFPAVAGLLLGLALPAWVRLVGVLAGASPATWAAMSAGLALAVAMGAGLGLGFGQRARGAAIAAYLFAFALGTAVWQTTVLTGHMAWLDAALGEAPSAYTWLASWQVLAIALGAGPAWVALAAMVTAEAPDARTSWRRATLALAGLAGGLAIANMGPIGWFGPRGLLDLVTLPAIAFGAIAGWGLASGRQRMAIVMAVPLAIGGLRVATHPLAVDDAFAGRFGGDRDRLAAQFPNRPLIATDGLHVSAIERHANEARFIVDGDVAASVPRDVAAWQLAAHLPRLVAPGARDLLAIGPGAGVVTATAARHPGLRIQRLQPGPNWVAGDLALTEAAGLVAPAADALYLADALVWCLAHREAYDAIVVSPGVPWLGEGARTLSAEGVAALRAALRPGGSAAVVLPLAAFTDHGFTLTLRTLRTAFAEVTVWRPAGDAVVLLARTTTGLPDLTTMERTYLETRPGTPYISTLLATQVLGPFAVDRLTGDGEIATLGFPRLALVGPAWGRGTARPRMLDERDDRVVAPPRPWRDLDKVLAALNAAPPAQRQAVALKLRADPVVRAGAGQGSWLAASLALRPTAPGAAEWAQLEAGLAASQATHDLTARRGRRGRHAPTARAAEADKPAPLVERVAEAWAEAMPAEPRARRARAERLAARKRADLAVRVLGPGDSADDRERGAEWAFEAYIGRSGSLNPARPELALAITRHRMLLAAESTPEGRAGVLTRLAAVYQVSGDLPGLLGATRAAVDHLATKGTPAARDQAAKLCATASRAALDAGDAANADRLFERIPGLRPTDPRILADLEAYRARHDMLKGPR